MSYTLTSEATLFGSCLLRNCDQTLAILLVMLNHGREFREDKGEPSFIPNFGNRHWHGETVSTAVVESTINQVVNKRMAERQPMPWSPRRAHFLLLVWTWRPDCFRLFLQVGPPATMLLEGHRCSTGRTRGATSRSASECLPALSPRNNLLPSPKPPWLSTEKR
jgi:hypothetical protein